MDDRCHGARLCPARCVSCLLGVHLNAAEGRRYNGKNIVISQRLCLCWYDTATSKEIARLRLQNDVLTTHKAVMVRPAAGLHPGCRPPFARIPGAPPPPELAGAMPTLPEEETAWSASLRPPPGLSLPADRVASSTISICTAEDDGLASGIVVPERPIRRPPVLPKGDNRFHPYQKLKRDEVHYGCRVCVCDSCGWWAFFNTKVLPWRGAFLQEESLRCFFDQEGVEYNVRTMREHYERGDIDVTWYCVWCLATARNRTPEEICEDYKLVSKKALARCQARGEPTACLVGWALWR